LYFALVAMRPGISFYQWRVNLAPLQMVGHCTSANSISFLPKAARLRSATLNFEAGADMADDFEGLWLLWSGVFEKLGGDLEAMRG
jgi:hypothetical protein